MNAHQLHRLHPITTGLRLVLLAGGLLPLTSAGLVSPAMADVPPTTAPASFQPTDTDLAQLKLAVETANKGDLPQAMELLNQQVASHPNWSTALLLKAQLLGLQGKKDLARSAYRAVLEIDPHQRDALLALATADAAAGDYKSALVSLDLMLKDQPGDGPVILLRAEAMVLDGQFAAGAKYINALLAAVKGEARGQVLPRMAPMLVRAGDFAAAETAATEWIGISPVAEAYACRADARRGLKRFEEAMADLRQGITVNGGQPTYPILFVGSQVMLDNGAAASAIVQLVDLLELAPGNPEVERAIDRAVDIRQAQMRASGKEDPLIPQVDYKPNSENIKQWDLRSAIGREKIKDCLANLQKATRAGTLTDTNREDCDKARNVFPCENVYSALMQIDFVFVPEAGDRDIKKMEQVRINARVAAAIAATMFSRYGGDTPLLSGRVNGYLEWADLQQHIAGAHASGQVLSAHEQLVVQAYQCQVNHDELGVLHDCKQADKANYATLSGPGKTLLERLTSNPARLSNLLMMMSRQFDEMMDKGDLKSAGEIADEMHDTAPWKPAGKLAKSKLLRKQNDLTKAGEMLKEAVEIDPQCDEAHFLIATDLEAAGKTDEALLEFNAAARGLESAAADSSPFVSQAIEARARLENGRKLPELRKIYSTACDSAFTDRAWATAKCTASRLMFGFDPPSAGVFAIAGVSAERLGNAAEAKRHLLQAISMDPKLEVYGELGEAQAALGEVKDAIDSYGKAIAMNPKNGFNYVARGKLLKRLHQSTSAADDFKSAIAKGDNSATTAFLLADSLEIDDPKTAAGIYEKLATGPEIENGYLGDDLRVVARAKQLLLRQNRLSKQH